LSLIDVGNASYCFLSSSSLFFQREQQMVHPISLLTLTNLLFLQTFTSEFMPPPLRVIPEGFILLSSFLSLQHGVQCKVKGFSTIPYYVINTAGSDQHKP